MNTFDAMRRSERKKQAAKVKKVHAYTGTVSIRLTRKDHTPIARAAALSNEAISTFMREAARMRANMIAGGTGTRPTA